MSEKLYTAEIAPGVWQIGENEPGETPVDAYLILGSERGLVVDALFFREDLYETVRKLTPLPLDLVLTHGHPDHAGRSVEGFLKAGCPVWMDPADHELLAHMPGAPDLSRLSPLKAGQLFELGGRRLTVIPCPGHTPGSVVLLDRAWQQLFSGDSVGSGQFWMQIDGCLPLKEFSRSLDRLWEEVGDLPLLKIYPGHRFQSPVQLNLQYLEDVRTITRHLADGSWEGEETVMEFGGSLLPYRHLAYGMMLDYCYDPKRLG